MNKLINIFIIALFALFVVLDSTAFNVFSSIVLVILSGFSYWLCYYLWKCRNEPLPHALPCLLHRLTILFIFLLLFVLFLAFSVWLVISEPFSTMCRFGYCESGPYGWAVALLSVGVALISLIVGLLFIIPRDK